MESHLWKQKTGSYGQNAYAGGARGAAAPSALFHGGAGRARIALCAALFPSLISCEGAFSGVVDSLVATNFSGGKSPDPQVNVVQL